MDRVVDKLHAAGIRIFMGTPTASIPAWLYKELGLAFALHIAHKKDALAFTRKSSHLFSDGQESFVTVCFWSRFDRSHHRLQKGAPHE
jgi:beta-galactosidase GanA